MNTLLEALYNLLSFLTEDAVANKYLGIERIPKTIMEKMDELCNELGVYLDKSSLNTLRKTVKKKFPDYLTKIAQKIEAIRFVRDSTEGTSIIHDFRINGYECYDHQQTTQKCKLGLAAAKRFVEEIE